MSVGQIVREDSAFHESNERRQERGEGMSTCACPAHVRGEIAGEMRRNAAEPPTNHH